MHIPGPLLRPLSRPLRAARRGLAPVNFITLHYTYFIVTCLLSAVIFWGSSTPANSVSFVDSLFLCVSAMTEAGLNTVNLSELNTWQQIMLFFLIMLGSAIWVSAFTVQVRKTAFERKFKSVIEERRLKRKHSRSASGRRFSVHSAMSRVNIRRNSTNADTEKEQIPTATLRPFELEGPASPMKRGRANNTTLRPSTTNDHEHVIDDTGDVDWTTEADHIIFSPDTVFRKADIATETEDEKSSQGRHSRVFSMQGVGARPDTGLHRMISRPQSVLVVRDAAEKAPDSSGSETGNYFLASGFVSRNSQFYGLTEAERERLGGVEYKALCFLSWIVPTYFVLWQLLGCIGLAAYVAVNRPETARANGLNPWWVGAFNGVSAFNNSGMSLLDANMTAFQTSYYMLLTMGLMILAGNTCFPIFLRLGIWSMLKLTPKSESFDDFRHTLRFLLDHPRRCYTNLFPSEHTWWLALVVVILNGIDWAGFEILNIGNDKLNSTLPIHIRVIDGLFQALAVRSGGFYVVAIPTVRISLQVLYVVMMYISVYPVVITMRNSNVYEERSLGIYADEPGYEDTGHQEQPHGGQGFWLSMIGFKQSLSTPPHLRDGKSYFVRQQLRAQLAHDAWLIVLAVFLIMIIEGSQFERDPATFSVFNVIFETVSAYGTVGISVGVPDNSYSFSGAWHKLSKLVLCAVMLRGRHRGLPVAVDKAVLLPHEKQDSAEEEDALIRLERRADGLV